MGSYRRTGGVYERSFTNGEVLVNPTTSPVTISLGGRFLDEGGAVVTTVTLQPHTGRILTRA